MAGSIDYVLDALEAQSESLRKELAVPRQSDVLRAAVEAGYLAAMAEGDVDEDQLYAMVEAIEIWSEGAAVEWETQSLLHECAEKADAEGAGPRAEAVGKVLARLGEAEAGLLFAALVATATKGIDESEETVLAAVGAAAGLSGTKVKTILERAAAIGE
jgi:tellurite resistance protein